MTDFLPKSNPYRTGVKKGETLRFRPNVISKDFFTLVLRHLLVNKRRQLRFA